MKNKNTIVTSILVSAALFFGLMTVLYSFMGSTNDSGDFVVERSQQLILIGLTFCSAVAAVFSHFAGKK